VPVIPFCQSAFARPSYAPDNGPATRTGTAAATLFGTTETGWTYSPWSDAAVPTTVATDDSGPFDLGVRFRSDVSGLITGIRFYKGAVNTGTHVGSLWTATGTLLATATFSGETATGWQQLNFTTPVTITANTT